MRSHRVKRSNSDQFIITSVGLAILKDLTYQLVVNRSTIEVTQGQKVELGQITITFLLSLLPVAILIEIFRNLGAR